MNSNRRHFLQQAAWTLGAVSASSLIPAWAQRPTATAAYQRLLILIELKGANDGLNTVIPYADTGYARLRPKLAIARDQIIQLDANTGLHPMLEKLLPFWKQQELAIVQGIGYAQPNQSHFRSIEIWDTASNSNEYLEAGWLARNFSVHPAPARFAADGVVVGSSDMGPLSGAGARTIALANTGQFLRQAKLAQPRNDTGNAALKHIMTVENEITHAASRMNQQYAFKTEFAKSAFGRQIETAAQLAAGESGLAVIRLTLNGFDTHANQLGTHANLLRELATGLETLKTALQEINRWDHTLVMTYAEFGRRPQENQSSGTDHGTANVHFLTGGKVKGGLYGQPPALNRLDGNGNLPYAVDFRSLYATVLEKWWSLDAQKVLNGRFATLPVLAES